MAIPKRLTKEELIDRTKDLWAKFYGRLPEVSFEEFYAEVLQEYAKQQLMSDEELEKYRLSEYHKLVEEVNKDLTPEEKQKLEEEDSKIIDEEKRMRYESGEKM